MTRRIANALLALVDDTRGATALEYGLIAALMAVAAIAGMMMFGNALTGLFDYVSNNVGNAAVS